MKKILLVSGVLILGGCDYINKLKSQDDGKSQVLPRTKVGVLISNGTDNPFFASAYKTFGEFSKSHPNIEVLTNDAKDNHKNQMAALDNMIGQGVQAIVINMVNARESDVVFNKVKPLNIPVVFFNRSPGQQKLFTYDKSFFVDGDAVQGGVIQGQKVLEGWKAHPEWDKNGDGKIQFAMLKGIEGNPSAEARTRWAIETIKSYPSLSVPAEQIALGVANFKMKQAKDMTNQWLKSPKGQQIEVILANNDSMALGALQAAEERSLKLPIFGIDAIPIARDLVKQGRLANTVINDASAQADVSMRVAINLAHGQEANKNVPYRTDYQVIKVPYKEL
ncbi:MAG: galactoside ABC transporter substrate-binding protein [Cardiobacteriales bacterium]|nr:MAG: galactoside ABC transporter substrate-binding protein [Cardiobacteriales bacterium]